MGIISHLSRRSTALIFGRSGADISLPCSAVGSETGPGREEPRGPYVTALRGATWSRHGAYRPDALPFKRCRNLMEGLAEAMVEPSTQSMTLDIIDYPGRRPEAYIADLKLESEGLGTNYLLAHHHQTDVTAAAYAEALFAKKPQGGGGVTAILGYCASSGVSAHYAEIVARETGQMPLLICFDASPCSIGDIEDCYLTALRQIEEDHPETALAPVGLPALVDRPHLLIDAVREDLTCRMVRTLAADGLTDDDVAGLVTQTVDDTHISWITHLLACGDARPPTRSGRTLNVVSRGYTDGPDWLHGEDVLTVRIDCDRADLLRHPETRSAVLGFLREGSTDA